jgi:hypothetical protein
MKYLKTFKERVEYGKVNPDDEYDIDVVTRDDYHEYEYCDGVMYELSQNGDDRIVYISEVENTPENMFYPDQIERYVQYIEDGGILQSFPVHSNKIATNLEEMLEYLYDNTDEGLDIMWKLFKNSYGENKVENEKMYDLYSKYYDMITDPEMYGFDYDELPRNLLQSVKTVEDLHEVYHEFEEPKKEDFDDIEEYEDAHMEWEDKQSRYDKDILRGLEDIIKYFEDEEEYTLTDFNHRFEALKQMGKERIYVEVM